MITPDDFAQPQNLEDDMVEFAIALHELLDRGMSKKDVHEFVEMIYDDNMRTLLLSLNNGRMND